MSQLFKSFARLPSELRKNSEIANKYYIHQVNEKKPILNSNQQTDLIFIRHANSIFNTACQQFRLKNKIQYDWNTMCSHPNFDKEVAYNPNYIDCSLTNRGRQECYKAKNQIDSQGIDLVLVSPHQRALETCAEIFRGNLNSLTPVVVQPLLGGSMWSVCDIGHSFYQKQKKFRNFDFSKVEQNPDLWFVDSLSISQKQLIKRKFKEKKIHSLSEKQEILLQLLKENKILESKRNLRIRTNKIKHLLSKLKQSYKKIALISHYYTIQYVNTEQFDEKDIPVKKIQIENCIPFYTSFENIRVGRK